MTQLIYLANARLPTEKAHGLQIVQMCEAFVQVGYEVTLVIPAIANQPQFQGIDPRDFYGVAPVFQIHTLWTLDLSRLVGRVSRSVFRLQAITYFLSVLAWIARQPREAILYSRDQFLLWIVGLVYPRRTLVYEAHTAGTTGIGRLIQRAALRRARLAVAVTRHLAREMKKLSGRRVLVEHDGIRAERFAESLGRAEARRKLELPRKGLIACYVGRLVTMRMDKGMGTVIEAFADCQRQQPAWDGHLLIVGGPDDAVAELRARWAGLGLPPDHFHAPGQVSADAVPGYLEASDICLMPLIWTQHFAYYASPLKLFEYMAAGRPILATDLPSFREVLAEETNALFVPPSDAGALAEALLRLAKDASLRERMGARNRQDVQHYTWRARAGRIRQALEAAASPHA